jgi:predicted nucleic acid-binding protein
LSNYLKVSPKDVKDALLNTLQFKKPTFIEDINKNLAKRALELAEKSGFESWDGYLISLMEQKNISIVYTLDISDFSKLNWITAINPLDEKEYREYQRWLKKLREKKNKE